MLEQYLNRIIHGDCLDVLRQLPDNSIDMILQDPPYNTTACKWEWDIMTKIDEFWAEWKRVIKDNGIIVMTASQPFASKLIISNLKWFKYEWIWEKVVGSNFVHAKHMPLKVYEYCLVFYNKRPTYNPIMEEREIKNERKSGKSKIKNNRISGIKQIVTDTTGKKKYPVNKIVLNRLNNELNSKYILHPTQKPVALFEYLIKTYTNEGDIVFDGFAGSGTTAVACKNLSRNYICVEIDEKYCQIAQQRIDQMRPNLLGPMESKP